MYIYIHFKALFPLKGHIFFTKLAAFGCNFVEVCMTI